MRYLILFLLLCQTIFAENAGSVLRVVDGDGGSGTAWSAHNENGKSYWVTCAHVVSSKYVTLCSSTGKPIIAQVIGRYPNDDIAILEAEEIPGTLVLPIGDVGPNSAVSAWGYPNGSVSPSEALGSVKRLSSIYLENRPETQTPVVVTTTVYAPGMSGGPLYSLDATTRIVGMVKGENGQEGFCVESSRLKVRLSQCLNGRCNIPQYWVRPQYNPPVFIPPTVTYQVAPTNPPRSQVGVPVSQQVDLSGIMKRLDTLEANQSKFVRAENLAPVLSQLIQENPEFFRGEKGDTGDTGAAGPGISTEQITAAIANYLRDNPQQVTIIVKDGDETIVSRGVPTGSSVTIPIEREVLSGN